MAVKLKDTGERMIPEFHKGKNIYGAHLARYLAGEKVVKDKIVLDIACGSGYGTKIISKYAKKVYGVDVDKDTVEYAKQNYPAKNIEYIKGSGTSIPLEGNSVDVVVSYETIEHIDDFETFIDEIKRVLKKDGILLLSTPNDKEYIEDNHFHLHEFTFKKLSKLVNKHFKNNKFFFQTLWFYSSILPVEMQENEWNRKIDTVNTVPLDLESCIYYFVICSNRNITETIEPVGVIGEHYKLKEVQENNKKNHHKHESLIKTRNENEKLKKELETIKNSKSWRLALKFQKANSVIKKS